jgi:hypothetical protein
MLEPTKETIPKGTPSRSTRLIKQSNEVQPTSVISLDGKFGSKSYDQLTNFKGESIDNEIDDGDGGSYDCNQLLGITMGAQRKKEIVQNVESHVLQDVGGQFEGTQGLENSMEFQWVLRGLKGLRNK